MNVDSVRKYCLSFPKATENLQWGEILCLKVAGKIFATLSLDTVPQRLCFKCTPETFSELVEREGINPAPYVGRYKWVSLESVDLIPDWELEDLVSQSYEMVAAKVKDSPARKVGKSPVKKAKVKPRSAAGPKNGKNSSRRVRG
jgi:predicted DNA-binding protein (MmcQ/YjbR family)